jgi:hypothetical protein
MTTRSQINLLNLIRCKYDIETDDRNRKYIRIFADPATGLLYITQNSPGYISGHIRARGRGNGSYPYNILETIDTIFGKEIKTIEVCSGNIRKNRADNTSYTVDINPETDPDLVEDGQTLSSIPSNTFNRWRCDPPYNVKTAEKMYGTSLPSPIKLLRAGARVCTVGSLMFLLLGHSSYQPAPQGVKRIGHIPISIIPNNEVRDLNIFYKYADAAGSAK